MATDDMLGILGQIVVAILAGVIGFIVGTRHERLQVALMCHNLRLQTPLRESEIAAVVLREMGVINAD